MDQLSIARLLYGARTQTAGSFWGGIELHSAQDQGEFPHRLQPRTFPRERAGSVLVTLREELRLNLSATIDQDAWQRPGTKINHASCPEGTPERPSYV